MKHIKSTACWCCTNKPLFVVFFFLWLLRLRVQQITHLNHTLHILYSPPWKTLILRSSTDWSWCDQPAVSVCCSLFLDGSRNVRFVLTLVWRLLLDVKNHNVLHYYFLLHRTHQLHVWGATFVIIIMICRCCHKSDPSVLCCDFSLRLWRFIQTS